MLRLAVRQYGFSQLTTLRFDDSAKAAYITLSNPKKRNTLSHATIKDLQQAFNFIEKKVHSQETKVSYLLNTDRCLKRRRPCL